MQVEQTTMVGRRALIRVRRVRGTRPRSIATSLRGLAAAVAVLCVAAAAPPALAAAPSGLPGPPPGAGTAFPLPPPPGQAPAPQAGLPAATISGTGYGPGLLTGYARPRGTKLPVQIACQADGRAQLSAPSLQASARYRCARGRSTITFTLTRAESKVIAAQRRGLIASLTVQQGALRERLSLSLGPTVPAPRFWISYYGLQCGAAPGTTLLTAPNFTVTPATTIDVRPWLVWYTPATGWQWLGTRGPRSSAWYRWTATPTGVAEWQQTGTRFPWTWGPLDIAAGHDTSVMSVFEAIYWYSHPVYVWEYARSGPSSTVNTTYCVYP